MALARTSRGSWNTLSSGGAIFTTGSFTPPNNSLLVVLVSADSTIFPDLSDSLTLTDSVGLTWTKRIVAGNGTGTYAVGFAVWTAPVTTGGSMTLTADCGDVTTIYTY